MEGYPYPSYSDSGNSSPLTHEIEVENAAVSWYEMSPPILPRVKLMCSYGGWIQPRPHDNQLSYVGGETKILAVDRPVRWPAILVKLASLYGAASPDEICFKYQLPGEDLDSLISVTNEEDLEHMMVEYDLLQRSTSKPYRRLRLFLFKANPLIGSATGGSSTQEKEKTDRQWFIDGLNSIPVQLVPALDHNNPLHLPPSLSDAALIPDFLSGVMPSPAPPVEHSSAMQPLPADSSPTRSDPGKEDRPQIAWETVMPSSVALSLNQIQDIQRLQIAENEHPQQPRVQQNGIEESLARVYHGEYYASRVQGKAPPATTQIFVAYLSEPSGITAGNYTSVVSRGDQPVYVVPASHGIYRSTTGQGYYTAADAAIPRLMPAEIYCEASRSPMYAAAPPPSTDAKVLGPQNPEVSAALRAAASQVAYDRAGMPVLYPGAIPTYQTVKSVGLKPETKMAKPSHVS